MRTAIGLCVSASRAAPPGARPALAAKIMRTIQSIRFAAKAGRAPSYASVFLTLIARWPVLRWFVARLGDGGDERFGLVALALALALTPRAVWRERASAWRLAAAGACVLAAALQQSLALASLPMLARALLCAGAFAVLICRGGGALGRAGLLALSLPVTATLQFFAGYPLRVLTAEMGRPLIALCGVATERAGVALQWAGGQVVVDAPCSGVHMLWTGGVFACALAAWLRLGAWRTLALGVTGFAAILLGNVLRAAALFFIESGLWSAPRWAHEGAGLAVFAALAAGLLRAGLRLKKRSTDIPGRVEKSPNSGRGQECPCSVIAFAAACAIAAMLPFFGAQKTITTTADDGFPGWPETFEGKPWIRLRKPEGAAAFASGFSGETGVFKQTVAENADDTDGDGGRIVVLRWIREASRGVHPAADCFRASGYKIKPSGLVRDARGVVWSEFFAERGGETWRVRERWRDEHGGAWTDVSAWYWSAVRGSGPWWAETVAER